MLALEQDLQLIEEAAVAAGEIALRYYQSDNKVWQKSGHSPVSEADFAVDAFLKQKLSVARPDYGWLSEETEDSPERLERDKVFVVDPIDGTRGFLEGRTEWCISIGIVENNRPIAGVLECPALATRYTAAQSLGSTLNGSPVQRLTRDRLESVTASKKLTRLIETQYAGSLTVIPFIPSLAYRIALVASGQVDAAFARAGAHDWDLAAAEIILREAGGCLTDLEGEPRLYNQQRTLSGPLLATGEAAHSRLISLAKAGGFLH